MASGASSQIELAIKTIANINIHFPPLEIQQLVLSECEVINNEYNISRMTIEDYKAKITAVFHRLGVILNSAAES